MELSKLVDSLASKSEIVVMSVDFGSHCLVALRVLLAKVAKTSAGVVFLCFEDNFGGKRRREIRVRI